MTRRLYIFLLIFILLSRVSVLINAQSVQATTSSGPLSTVPSGDGLPKEGIFLHHDKPFYFSGENLWFRAYVKNQDHPGQAAVSYVVYADLVNAEGRIINSACLKLDQNMAPGNFYLADSLPTGLYRLRAYSNWMKNFDPDYFFNEDLIIINRFDEMQNLLQPNGTDSISRCSFFYESIPGDEKKVHVVYRLTNSQNVGIDATGRLENAEGAVLTQLKTTHAGIGSFDLNNDSTQQPFVAFQKGKHSKRFLLPKNEPSLYSMGIRKERKSLTIEVRYHGSDPNLMNEDVLMGVFTGGAVRTTREKTLKEGQLALTLDSLPNGILRLFVMNKAGHIYAERFYASPGLKYPAITCSADKPVYGNREKGKLLLKMKGADISPEWAEVSVSISAFPEKMSFLSTDNNIYASLFKEAGIPVPVEDPSWYFGQGNDSVETALNDMLLTQRGKGTSLDQLSGLQDRFLSNCAETSGIHLAGKLVQKQDGKPVQGVKILLASPDSIPVIKSATTDAGGNFSYVCDNYYGNKDIVIQTDEISNADRFDVNVHSNLAKTSSDRREFKPMFDSLTVASLAKEMLRLKIDKTYDINSSTRGRSTKLAESFKAYGIPDRVIYPDDYIKLNGLKEIVTEILPGVWLRKKEGKFVFQAFDESRGSYTMKTTLLVDGIPVKDPGGMINWDSDKYWKIDLSYSPRIFGDWMMGSVVSVFTRTLNCPLQLGNIITRINWQGYLEPDRYQPPVYEKQDERDSPRPDFRSLLYWNPDVAVGSDSAREIDFYTSDDSGTYYVNLQGITRDGLPVSLTLPIRVGESGNSSAIKSEMK